MYSHGQKKLVFLCLDVKIDGVFNGGGCPRPRSGEVSRRDFRGSGDAAAGVTDAGLRFPSILSAPERKCSIIKLGRAALFEDFCSDSALLCISVGEDGSLTLVHNRWIFLMQEVADDFSKDRFSCFKTFFAFQASGSAPSRKLRAGESECEADPSQT
jgi:hypothetical protein